MWSWAQIKDTNRILHKPNFRWNWCGVTSCAWPDSVHHPLTLNLTLGAIVPSLTAHSFLYMVRNRRYLSADSSFESVGAHVSQPVIFHQLWFTFSSWLFKYWARHQNSGRRRVNCTCCLCERRDGRTVLIGDSGIWTRSSWAHHPLNGLY